MVSHVLSPFSREETERMGRVTDVAGDAVRCILHSGVDAAMNRYNGMIVTGDPGD